MIRDICLDLCLYADAVVILTEIDDLSQLKWLNLHGNELTGKCRRVGCGRITDKARKKDVTLSLARHTTSGATGAFLGS